MPKSNPTILFLVPGSTTVKRIHRCALFVYKTRAPEPHHHVVGWNVCHVCMYCKKVLHPHPPHRAMEDEDLEEDDDSFGEDGEEGEE